MELRLRGESWQVVCGTLAELATLPEIGAVQGLELLAQVQAASASVANKYFSHSSNRFWAALHLSGFTDIRLQPQNERRLLEYGCGITPAVRRPTTRADEIFPEEFGQARPEVEAKMLEGRISHSNDLCSRRA